MAKTTRDFEIPEFLQSESAEEICERLFQLAKEKNIDITEGSIFFNAVKPVALDQAERDQFKRIELFKLMWPDWSYGIWLEMLGEASGTTPKKQPTHAEGTLKIQGVPGTLVPIGFVFATRAVGENPSVLFKSKQPVTIDSSGFASIGIQAVEAGTRGNVDTGTITLMSVPMNGIISITNEQPTTGGTDLEEEESFRQRVLNSNKQEKLSGADSDYIRWAEEVDGVGKAYVIPEWDGAGTVKVVVIDANGLPANQSILDSVQQHIAPSGKNRGGLAPVGHLVTVVAPVRKLINYQFSWELSPDVDAQETQDKFKAALLSYYKDVGVGGTVHYNRVGALLINLEGVVNYSGLTVDGGAGDVQLAGDEYPGTGTVQIV
ncbi:MAG: baseplate J/gp47 family protein [Firmicutes bacterium]|nr:baseplate J/gp47 family protein [Bacillota bacterium]